MIILALSLSGATAPELPQGHAPALDQLPETGAELRASAWLVGHFTTPVPAQGAAPAGWSELEGRLDPAACGTCHPAQFADWRESWHAGGMGPGLMGQLADWDGSQDKTVGQCNRCHAPLAEQYPRLPTGAPDEEGAPTWEDNPDYVPEMRGEGLTCAGCHVRAHTRFGPPRRGPEPTGEGRLPHDGFSQRAEFQDPSFCSPCHDFQKKQLGLEGKLIQETGEEWRRTPMAAEGRTCQTCHMPEGRHLWKGIHDADMVRSGVEIAVEATFGEGLLGRVKGALRLTNTGAGHRLPTYSTPDVVLILEQIDAEGEAIAGTTRTTSVGRWITPNLKEELYDTRLLPGESATLPYDIRRASKAVALAARVEVWPDEAYRRFYEIKLKHPDEHQTGLTLLEQARDQSLASRYTLWEERVAAP